MLDRNCRSGCLLGQRQSRNAGGVPEIQTCVVTEWERPRQPLGRIGLQDR